MMTFSMNYYDIYDIHDFDLISISFHKISSIVWVFLILAKTELKTRLSK